MMAAAALLLSSAGFAALAFSMHKHHHDLFQARPTRQRRLSLRISGWILMSLSLAVGIDRFGVSIGIVFWIGMLTVAALAVTAALSWRRVRLKRFPRNNAMQDADAATNTHQA